MKLIFVDRDIMSSSLLGDGDVYNVEENLSIDFNDFTHTNDLDSGPVTTFGRDHKDNAIGFSKDGATPNSKFSFGLNNDLLAVLVKKTNNGEGQNTFWTSTSTEHESLSEETPAQVVKVLSSTTTAPVRKTSTISLKDYTKGRVQFDEDEVFEVPADEHTTRAIDDVHHHHDLDGGIQVGGPNLRGMPLRSFGFTSGHQNSFGVPIEEDERLLRMLNEQLLKLEKQREVIYSFQLKFLFHPFLGLAGSSSGSMNPPLSENTTGFHKHPVALSLIFLAWLVGRKFFLVWWLVSGQGKNDKLPNYCTLSTHTLLCFYHKRGVLSSPKFFFCNCKYLKFDQLSNPDGIPTIYTQPRSRLRTIINIYFNAFSISTRKRAVL